MTENVQAASLTSAKGSASALAPIAAPPDRQAAFRAARRHSFIVRLLRWLLPLGAIGILALYFLPNELSVPVAGGKIAIEKISASSKALKMLNPRVEGVSQRGDRYVITAKRAEQDFGDLSRSRLFVLRGNVASRDGTQWQLAADTGFYDGKLERLRLKGNIRIRSDTGFSAQLSQALIDMKRQTLTSQAAVVLSMPSGTAQGNSLFLNSAQRQAELAGGVTVTLTPPRNTSSKSVAGKATAVTAASQPPVPGLDLFEGGENAGPITITAKRLHVDDKRRLALFQETVVAKRENSRLETERLEIAYAGADGQASASATPAALSGQEITRVSAPAPVMIRLSGGRTAQAQALEYRPGEKRFALMGKVKLSGANGQEVTADRLTFETDQRKLSLTGGVVMRQGKNVLRGPRFEADLATGYSRFPPGGRVTGRFFPKTAARTNRVATATLPQGINRNAPIDIAADSLEIRDKEKRARFVGNVRVRQEKFQLTARKLWLRYSGNLMPVEASTENSKTREPIQIRSVRAEGKVLITTPDAQTVTGDWAEYDAGKHRVVVGGKVVLTTGDNVLKGEKLIVDLKTGKSRFIAGKSRATPLRGFPGVKGKEKRIRGVIIPQTRPGTAPAASPKLTEGATSPTKTENLPWLTQTPSAQPGPSTTPLPEDPFFPDR